MSIPTAKFVPILQADGDMWLNKKHAREAGSFLSAGFLWSETAEGQEFWAAVVERLKDMAEGKLHVPPPPVNPEDWRPANSASFTSSVGYWLARNKPEQLPNVDKIARRMAKKYGNAGGRYYVKASKQEQAAGCRFVRVYAEPTLDADLPAIIGEIV